MYRYGLLKFSFTWLFVSSKRPRSVMAEPYLLDSYSVGVESGWGSQMVGVFESPDGCSVWCSVTLGRLIDMLPPSPPLSISSPPLPSPPPPAESLLRRWIPTPWPLAADLERMGWDSPLSPPKKTSMFGLPWTTPICHCRIAPTSSTTWLSKGSERWAGTGLKSAAGYHAVTFMSTYQLKLLHLETINLTQQISCSPILQ